MWLAKAAKGTSLGRKIATARWNFMKRAEYCTMGSRIRLALHDLGFGRVLPRLHLRLKGRDIDVWLRPRTTDVAVFRQVWKHGQNDLPLRSAPASIIDAGANIGLASLYFAVAYPGSRIVAVEPEQSNFALLKRNTRAFENVRAIRAALWSDNVTLVVTDPGAGKHAFQVRGVQDASGGRSSAEQRIEGVTVPEICRRENWTRVGLLKLDIEGAELEVLNASSTWIEAIDVLAVELHDDLRPGCKEAFEHAVTGFPVRASRGELDLASRADLAVGR
jgi:FkbM family methyltransferase